jgi:lipoprotein-anchoring transpeptidase ErfK/SrfK
MQVRARFARNRHYLRWGVVVLAALPLLVSACTSSTTGGTPTGAATEGPGIVITPGDGALANPKTPIVVKASNGALTSVSVVNAKGAKVKGAVSADKVTWTSSEPLGYGAKYEVTADAQGADGKPQHQVASVQTISPAVQAFPSFIPPPNVPEVGVGQPVVVKFDQDISDKATAEKALTVTANPLQTGGWYWLSKREVHYRPQEYWKAGSTITVKADVYGVDLGKGVFGQTDRTITFKVHDSWIGKADGATKQMQIVHNGQVENTMPISLGSPEFPSHLGAHVISDKQREYTMDSCTFGLCPPNPKAYHSKEFFDERISNDGEFVHENPNTVGQQGSANVSHGCVNLSPENAAWFFDRFGLGDVVEVTNSGGQQLPIDDTYGDWALPWDQWQKGSALR